MKFTAPLPLTRKELAFFSVFALFFALAFALPPMAQSEAYHAFADERAFFGIPRFMDVATNLGFFFAGLYGLRSTSARKDSFTPAFLWAADTFFWGVLLTSFGSAFYHWAPDSARLVWDRLPMTIAFAGACAALGAARVSQRAGFIALGLCLASGGWAVAHWLGAGNLTPYATMQFGGLAWIMGARLFGSANPREDFPWAALLAFYALAKLAEFLDPQIFLATHGMISGHSLKHLLAAAGALSFALAVRRAPRSSELRAHPPLAAG